MVHHRPAIYIEVQELRSECERLEKEIESLRTKLAEDEKDAERYRFVRSNCVVILPYDQEVEDDADIDAAIAKSNNKDSWL